MNFCLKIDVLYKNIPYDSDAQRDRFYPEPGSRQPPARRTRTGPGRGEICQGFRSVCIKLLGIISRSQQKMRGSESDVEKSPALFKVGSADSRGVLPGIAYRLRSFWRKPGLFYNINVSPSGILINLKKHFNKGY